MTGRFRYEDFGTRLTDGCRPGEVQICYDATTDTALSESERQVFASINVGAFVTMPFMKGGEWVASLAVHSIQPRRWKQNEIEAIKETTERTWTAVEKAKAEEALQKSEEKYHSLFESIDEGFCIYEVIYNDNNVPVDLRWVEVNPAYERQMALKDVLGKRHSELSPGTEQYWLNIFDKVIKTGEAMRFEDYHGLTGCWYHTYSSRIGGNDSRQVAVVFSDITERKNQEAEKEFSLKLSDALSLESDARGITRLAVNMLGAHLKADRVQYSDINTDEDYFQILENYVSISTQKIVGRFPYSAFGPPGEKLKRGESLIIHDVSVG